MIYCFDTYYTDTHAITAAIGIEEWDSAAPAFELVEVSNEINDYESGAFYKRELPCLLSIIDKIEIDPLKDILLVDGYVILSDDAKLGLGGYLYKELGESIPVIGVAKNNFFSLNDGKKELFRGESKKPLFVTSMGIDVEVACQRISEMDGPHRLPTILRMVDQLGRSKKIP